MVDVLIRYIHLSFAHFGSKKCLQQLQRQVFFANMSRRVRQIIKECDLCQRTKVSTTQHKRLMQNILPKEVGDVIGIDVYGPLPRTQGSFTQILVVVGLFSK